MDNQRTAESLAITAGGRLSSQSAGLASLLSLPARQPAALAPWLRLVGQRHPRAANLAVELEACRVSRQPATVDIELDDERALQCLIVPQWRNGLYRGLTVTFVPRNPPAAAAPHVPVLGTGNVAMYRCSADGRFLAASPALVRLLGYHGEAEVLALDPVTDLYRSPPRAFQLPLAPGRSTTAEVAWRKRDGTDLTVRLSCHAVGSVAGASTEYEVVVVDITERRALEEQLRQAQKMEAVGQLAGGMAHDFNNLLTTILATVELLRNSPDVPHAALLEDLDAIHHAGERGAELVRKLLAFGRKQRLEMRSLDVAELVQAFGGMLRRVVREDIDIRLSLERGATVWADAGALEQIVMNLVTNARDAMPGGGLVLVQVRRSVLDWMSCKSLGWGRPGEYVILSVSDTGIGMDRRTQQRIFEPFFTTKGPGQGTGLGLAVAYGLVRQHEGSMHVYSELGHGTTVKVYLPVAAQAVQPAPDKLAATPPPGGSETILLVEDEDVIRRTAVRVLSHVGYNVITAANGEEALAQFERQADDIRLIMTDVVMPRMGGPQLVARLRERGHNVRVLFMSGYAARDIAETRLLDPADAFVSKPWTITELLGAVRNVLDQPPRVLARRVKVAAA